MLKKLTLITILLASFIASAVDNQSNIAVINSDKVKTDTKAGQSIMQQLEALQKTFNEKVAKLQKDFEAKKQELDKQKAVLSKEAFAKKESEFNTQFSELRKSLQQEAQKYQQMEQNALIELNNLARKVIDEIVKEGKYTHILPNEVVIHADPKSDITSQVVAGVDKKTDKITLKEPAPQAATK
jgi:outer membrane protein